MPGIADADRGREKLPKCVRGRNAVGLTVKKVSPAADALRQDHPGDDDVRQLGQGEFVPPGIDQGCQRPADDAAVDGQSAVPDVEDGERVDGVFLPLEGHIVQARADDAHRQ